MRCGREVRTVCGMSARVGDVAGELRCHYARVGAFGTGEHRWVERFGNLRNMVRQELIARQLAEHVSPHTSVLDVGCGQGTQAIRLAAQGCAVTGVDSSVNLLAKLTASAHASGVSVEVLHGDLGELPRLLGPRTFGLVCAHGLLMYLDDAEAALAALAQHVAASGLLSITFRNGDALAFRPGMRRDWRATLAAFQSETYVNELGVSAHAHRLDDMAAVIERLGFDIEARYGVRIFTDPASPDEPPPDRDFEALLEAEWRAGQRDPYRGLGSQIHLIARRR